MLSGWQVDAGCRAGNREGGGTAPAANGCPTAGATVSCVDGSASLTDGPGRDHAQVIGDDDPVTGDDDGDAPGEPDTITSWKAPADGRFIEVTGTATDAAGNATAFTCRIQVVRGENEGEDEDEDENEDWGRRRDRRLPGTRDRAG